jgi:hypothetical protein
MRRSPCNVVDMTARYSDVRFLGKTGHAKRRRSGTWRLDPEPTSLKVIMIGGDVAQVYGSIMFTIGGAGQPSQQVKFLMNQVLVKTQSGWRVSSILPIPVPALGQRGRVAHMPTAATTADDSPCGMIKAERSGRLPTKRSVQAVPLCGSILIRMLTSRQR